MKLLVVLIFALVSSCVGALGDFVTSPNLLNGNVNGPGPFLISSSVAPSYRYQEVHQATDFTDVSTLPLIITEISFAAERSGTDVSVPNVEVRFSTTAGSPDSLSPVFANNVGTDEVIVFSGSVRMFDTGTERFGIHIPLQQPFIYNPSMGNLLLEVRNHAPIPPHPNGGDYALDAHFQIGDSVSSLGAINVNATTGESGTGGYVTRFTFTTVPEPSTIALSIVGVIGLALYSRKRRRSRPRNSTN